MKKGDLGLLISNIMIGLSFLAEGMDRVCLVFLGIFWYIAYIIINK